MEDTFRVFYSKELSVVIVSTVQGLPYHAVGAIDDIRDNKQLVLYVCVCVCVCVSVCIYIPIFLLTYLSLSLSLSRR